MLLVFFAVRKGCCYSVFRGDERLEADFNRPVDSEFVIIPAQGAIHIGAVGRGDFVMKIRNVAENKKAMGATWRDPETIVGFGIEHITIPYAIGGRAFAKIDQHIENCAGGNPYELALRGITRLVVESTQDMLGGTAVVVLDEVEIQTSLTKCLAIPCLHKETPRVAEDFWFQKPGIMNFSGDFFHKVEPRISRMGTNKKRQVGLVSLGPSLKDGAKIVAIAGFAEAGNGFFES